MTLSSRLVTFLALLSVAAPVAGQGVATADTAALRGRLQAILDDIYEAGQFPGATAAIALPDGSTLALAVGY
jgi:hypothetical protein